MTASERDELKERETRIRRSWHHFLQVGEDLLAILDKRLYRDKYKTFEVYVSKEFSISKRHAYRLMNAFKVTRATGGGTRSERQTRPLTPFTPETQKTIWNAAKEKRPNPTEDDVSDAIDNIGSGIFDFLPAQDKIALAQREKKKIVTREKEVSRKKRFSRACENIRTARKLLAKELPEVDRWLEDSLRVIGAEL